MATEGTAISNESAAAPAEAIEYRDAPDGKAGRLVAQTGAGAAGEPQLLDQATGAPVKGAESVPQTPPMPATVSADASNIVHLPEGASVEKIKVVGTDIVLEQPDGSTITIQNAALKVPTFVIGDAEIPRETLVAVLGENGINVAAGPDGSISVVSNQSSGGDLSDADGDIGQAGPVIDLLAPTALEFPALEATERLPFALDPNEGPSIIPDSEDNPGGIAVSDRQVDEAGVGGGSRAGDGTASVSGVFVLTDPDGLDDIASLTINGQTFAIGGLIGQTVAGQFGTLTITSYNPVTGVAEYTYELTSSVTSSGVNPGTNIEQDRDIFDLTVTDRDGAGGSAILQIDIVDDVPVIGITDPASPNVVEGQTLAGNWTLSAGADGVGTVDVTVGNTTQILTLTAGQSVAFTLAEGTLTVNADKTWTFAANDNLSNPAGVNVSFTLSAKDADNDTTSDSQTITVTDGAGPTVDPLAASASLALDDQNLAGGSTPLGSDTSSGTIGFVAGSDAIATIVFGDTSTLTGALTWDRVSDTQIVGKAGGVTIVTLDLVRNGDGATVTATLSDNYASHPGINADDLASLGSVKVIASDTDGDQAEGTVSVSVSDDVPTAVADTDSATEDGVLVADGNVLTGSGGTDANGTDGVKDVRGADGASVTAVSFGDTAGVVGAFTAGQYGTLVLNADGSYSYALNNAHAVVQGLAAGQVAIDTFSYEITDGDGDKSSTTVTITITGTNDVPVITSAVQSGSVTEVADNAGGENATTHAQNGAVTFADVDTLDTHSASFSAQGGSYLGSFALAAVNQAGDAVGWSFEVADSVLDSLQAGQTLTQKYDVTVDDGHGGTATQTVTITITGTNDVPVITSAVQSGSVTEIADGVAGENATTHAKSGAVTFADVDTLDTHSASFSAQGGSYLGSFALAAVNQTGDSIGWSFEVADGVLDSLQAGQVLTQKYDVTVDDGHGGTATQTVTITITGTNDVPVITSVAQSGAVTERADNAAGENAVVHVQGGAVTFADVDTLDTHSASFAAQGGGYLGTFSLGPVNQATDKVGWSFKVADGLLDSLQAGQTLTQKYDVTVDDGHGGTAVQTVTITITGTNDAPVITSGWQLGGVMERFDGTVGENAVTHTENGTVTFADVDTLDTHSASFTAQGGGYLGTFSLDSVNQTNDAVGWNFQVADGVLDSLQAGQILTQKYKVVVNDGHGGTAAQTVTIVILGTNDAPVITSGTQSATVTERADGAAGENAVIHVQGGAVTFADVDTLDTHSASFWPQGGGYLGSFSLGSLNQATDSVGWTFKVADGVLDSLQAGQTLTQKYNVIVNDGHGGIATQTVTIVITGTNDAPVITSGAQSAAVTERADGAAGENAVVHVHGGAVAFADVDTLDTHSASFAAQGGGYLGTFALAAVNQVGNSVGWSFKVADGVIDSLQAGQSLTQKYDVTVNDGHGGTATQTVTVVITGTNDAPVITSGMQNGTVTEVADNAGGENATTHAQNGAVTFADVDTLDTHSASFSAQGGSYLGSFALAAVNQAGDAVGWSFEVADSVLDSLQAGQTLTQKYDVTVDDGHGGTATQTVTITITGTNDVPVITSAVQSGSVTEIADGAAGENATTHAKSGAVTFADVDTLDTHSASFSAQGGSYLGSFALAAVNQAGDSVGWSFEVADGVLDSLQAGQTLTQKYDVTVDDGHGGTATQTVTITITGTNDVPVITSAVQSGSVTETADGAAGENATTHAQAGSVTFADVDTLDTHSAGFTAQGGSYLGTFALGTLNQAGDAVGWSFEVADSVLNSLQAGQTLTQKYDVTVDDGHGGTATQTVTITITGTNDVPVITSAVQSGSVTEIADGVAGENATTHAQAGSVTFADVDTLDTHSAGFTAQGGGYLGTFALGTLNQAGDSVGWSFEVADGVLDSLQAGQTLTQKYDVTVDDGHGGTATQTVTITITGTNDVPVITSAVQSGSVTEIADGAAGENATTHAQNGAVTFADVDTLDTHSAGFSAQGGGYLGSFALAAVNQTGDSIGWSFEVADGVLDSLQAGQTLTQKYDVTIDDGHGGTATQTVTITLTGTNDVPVITSAVQSGAVAEIADGVAGENTTTHAQNGAVTFADVDTLDTHSASFSAQGGSYLGSFALAAVNQAGDSVGWSFQVADSVLDSLNAGETLTQKYDVTVDDGHGGTATQTVTITITGTNDGVSVNGLSSSAEVTMYEKNLPDGSSPNAAALTQAGSFSVTAPDGLAGLKVNGTAVMTGGVFAVGTTVDTALGLLTITGYTPTMVNGVMTGATFTYSYLFQDNSLGHTGAGADNGVFDNFSVVVTDEDGSTASGTLNVQIIDDVPCILSISNAYMANGIGALEGAIEATPGADGIAVYRIDSVSGLPTGWTASGTGTGQVLLKDNLGADIYRLTTNTDGTYELEQLKERPGTPVTIQAANQFNNSPTSSYDFGFATFTALAASSGQVKFNANTSQTGGNEFGIGNTAFTTGEKFKIEFEDDVSSVTLQLGTVQNAGSIQFTVKDGNGTPFTFSKTVAVGQTSVTILPSDVGFKFDYIEVLGTNSINASFKTVSYTETVAASDLTLTFAVTGRDQDGDLSNSSTLTFVSDGSETTANAITGSAQDDVIYGGVGNDNLSGSSGNDVIYASVGTDTIDGGTGTDVLDLSDATGPVTFTLTQSSSNTFASLSAFGLGNETYKNMEGVKGSDYDDTLNGSGSNDALIGGAGNDTLSGNGGSDTLYGGVGNDALYGNPGNDILVGGTGDDILYGGPGSDTMTGGSGQDTFVVDLDSLQLGIDDVIADYNATENDYVDLSALLGNLPTGTNLDGNYVQLVQDGQNANLQVDTDGSAGNASGWHTVAVLEDFQVSTEVVKILFNENGTKTSQDV
ncbi:beta strand repeat-containing protein [Ensifer sp. 4252]|uniref:beta strand repeat-containing protein n=1 Tax=Ensifer sp. 4252 TaxID=3373915 RepID=UPI003D22FD6F